MAMLLRTSKNCAALYFRIVFVLSVTLIFLFICEYSNHENQEVNINVAIRNGRRILAISTTNFSKTTTAVLNSISNSTKNVHQLQ